MIEGLQQTNISLDKGIVRTPSLGQEGELSECVNLIPHAGEMVRIHEPQPLTEDVTGQYLYYTFVWEKREDLGSNFTLAMAEPVRTDLHITVRYREGEDIQLMPITLPNGTSKVTVEMLYLNCIEDIVEVEVGDKDFMLELPNEGYVGLKAYRLFEFATPNDITFPTEEEQANMPIELQPGELLLETNRCAGKENLIVRNGDTLVYYRPGEGRHVILTLEEGDVEVVTIGQTLVISQGITKRYFLWGEEGYKEQDLLNAVPEAELLMGDTVSYEIDLGAVSGNSLTGSIPWRSFPSLSWQFPETLCIQRKHTADTLGWDIIIPSGSNGETEHKKFVDGFWGFYNKTRNGYKEEGMHCFPFFVRWGIELYDGSVIHLSAPILMMPSSIIRPSIGCYLPDAVGVDLIHGDLNTPRSDLYAIEDKFSLTPMFTPRYFYAAFDASALKGIGEDLIKGIVIYATPEREVTDPEYAFDDFVGIFGTENKRYIPTFTKIASPIKDGLGYENYLTNTSIAGTFDPEKWQRYLNFVWTPPAKKDIRSLEDMFTDPVDFYELATIPLSSLRRDGYKTVVVIGDGSYYPKGNPDKNYTSKSFDPALTYLYGKGYNPYYLNKSVLTSLTSHAPLSSVLAPQTNSIVAKANSTYSYNSRLFYGGVVIKRNPLLKACQILADNRTALKRGLAEGTHTNMYLRFGDKYLSLPTEEGDYLKGWGGETPFIAVPYGEATGVGIVASATPEASARVVSGVAFNAYEASVVEGNDWAGSVSLSKRKSSLGNYTIWTDITGTLLKSNPDLAVAFISPSEALSSEWEANDYPIATDTEIKSNVIAVTKVANPWVIEAVYELACGEIRALSSATDALSEGQFGEFPIYAFTDNGIYALTLSEEGVVAAKQPLSRDVLLPTGGVCQTDKAVIFPTKGGLMALTGRTPRLLSASVSGKNVDEKSFDIDSHLYIEDTAPFIEQLDNSFTLYDSAERLLHVFSDSNGSEEIEEHPGWAINDEKNSYTIAEEVRQPTTNFNEGYPIFYQDVEGVNIITSLEWDLTHAKDECVQRVVRMYAGDVLRVFQWALGTTDAQKKVYLLSFGENGIAVGSTISFTDINLAESNAYTATEDCYIGLSKGIWLTPPVYWSVLREATIQKELHYYTYKTSPLVEQFYRQKHYVYDLESGQWATQILDKQLTTCVAGYPFSTMQLGRQLMQYNNELEADIVKQGWLLTRPISFSDPFTRKMLADIRLIGQKTHADTKFKVQVYISEDRVKWHRLTSLKGRSAKWYRFLIKADMCGLDTLTGISCQYVPRFGSKLR